MEAIFLRPYLHFHSLLRQRACLCGLEDCSYHALTQRGHYALFSRESDIITKTIHADNLPGGWQFGRVAERNRLCIFPKMLKKRFPEGFVSETDCLL